MNKLLPIAAVFALLIGGAAPAQAQSAAPQTDQTSPHAADARERGRYLADAADCVACHTVPGGKPYAGGVAFPTPVGTVRSTNITPDPGVGIGAYSLEDFERALRHGIRRDGATLYPAMPYPSYARLTQRDVADLYAYFMHDVEPVAQAAPGNGIPWPLSMRWPLAVWRKLNVPDAVPFDAARYPDAQMARGAYLVQGPGHCGACHTPRGPLLAEKAMDERSPDYLAGGQLIEGWYAVNLRGDAVEGLGAWSEDDVVATLATGRNQHYAVAAPPMNDVVVHSLQKLNPADLQAIAVYLKSLSPHGGEVARFDPAHPGTLPAERGDDRGAQIYLDSCAACHATSGKGAVGTFPALAGNPTVLAPDPSSLIRVVLGGAALPGTHTRPSRLGMPGFDWRYTDQEVAQLATLLRTSWGNSATPVTTAQVAAVRADLKARAAAPVSQGTAP